MTAENAASAGASGELLVLCADVGHWYDSSHTSVSFWALFDVVGAGHTPARAAAWNTDRPTTSSVRGKRRKPARTGNPVGEGTRRSTVWLAVEVLGGKKDREMAANNGQDGRGRVASPDHTGASDCLSVADSTFDERPAWLITGSNQLATRSALRFELCRYAQLSPWHPMVASFDLVTRTYFQVRSEPLGNRQMQTIVCGSVQ